MIKKIVIILLSLANFNICCMTEDDRLEDLFNAICITGDLALVKKLIDSGVDVNLKNVVENTPLHWCAYTNREEIARLLIAKGANINTQDAYGNSPLRIAIERHNIAVADLLINNTNINIQDDNGWTPLHHAILSDSIDMVNLMLIRGANINAQSICRDTPLHLAVFKGNKEIVGALLEAGANKNIKDNRNEIALDLTRNQEIINLLNRYDAYAIILKR